MPYFLYATITNVTVTGGSGTPACDALLGLTTVVTWTGSAWSGLFCYDASCAYTCGDNANDYFCCHVIAVQYTCHVFGGVPTILGAADASRGCNTTLGLYSCSAAFVSFSGGCGRPVDWVHVIRISGSGCPCGGATYELTIELTE